MNKRIEHIFIWNENNKAAHGRFTGLILRFFKDGEWYRLRRQAAGLKNDKRRGAWRIIIGPQRHSKTETKYCGCSTRLAQFLYWLAVHRKYELCIYVMERRYAQGHEAAEDLITLYWNNPTKVEHDLASNAGPYFVRARSVG